DTYARIGRNWTKTDSSTEVGSTVQTTGDVTLFAGRDLTTRAAYVNSEQGALTAIADRDINITTGTNESHLEGYNKSRKKGLLSSKSTTEHRTSDSEAHTGSTFSGDTIY